MVIEQAAVVPAVIIITQIIKPLKKISGYSGVIALLVAFVGTAMVSLYGMSEETFNGLGSYGLVKFLIECFFTAIATWLSASKIYDLVYGDKKWDKEVEVKLIDNYMRGINEGKTIICEKDIETNSKVVNTAVQSGIK